MTPGMLFADQVPAEDFFRRVAHVARGCPSEVLRGAVVQAGREFCERTWIWEAVLEPVQTQDGVRGYQVFAPDADILAIKAVALDGRDVKFTTPDRSTVQLWDEPKGGLDLVATVILAPAPDAHQLPRFLLSDWPEAVASRARSILLDMPGTDWFGPQLAEKYRLEFERLWVPRTRVEVTQRGGRALSVRKRRFI